MGPQAAVRLASTFGHDIANEWINEIAFADIALARWLQKPETEVIMLMVRGVLPYPTDQAVTVLTEAVQIAARQRTMRQVALTAAGGVALAGLVYMMIQN